MQVRLNRCTESEPGLHHAFTVTVSDELPRNRNARVTDRRSKQLIVELCSFFIQENNVIFLGHVFPKLNKFFSSRVSRYINKAGSTNMILVKYEVELENCALLITGFCFVQGINFPYLMFINFIFNMKFIIYMNLHKAVACHF